MDRARGQDYLPRLDKSTTVERSLAIVGPASASTTRPIRARKRLQYRPQAKVRRGSPGVPSPEGAAVKAEKVVHLTSLLDKLYQEAAALSERRCRTLRFRRFCRCRGDRKVLSLMREEVLELWEGYRQEPVLQQEITAETVAAHQLLREGLESWLEALDRALENAQDEGAVERALWGNRLLLVVGDQARRLGSGEQEMLQIIDNISQTWQV